MAGNAHTSLHYHMRFYSCRRCSTLNGTNGTGPSVTGIITEHGGINEHECIFIGVDRSIQGAHDGGDSNQSHKSISEATAHITNITDKNRTKPSSFGWPTPPIPRKLAEKIWRNEFIQLHELLPARLGIPSPTLLDVLAGPSTPKAPLKQISSIEEWVMCFNTYVALVAQKQPNRIKDLLAYSSIVVNASKQFEGTPWLEYDTRFRKEAALQPNKSWAVIDASTWTLCFTSAKPKPDPARRGQEKRFHPYKPASNICRNFNNHRCFYTECRYRHVCLHCEKPNHTDDQCPECKLAKGGFFRPQQKPS